MHYFLWHNIIFHYDNFVFLWYAVVMWRPFDTCKTDDRSLSELVMAQFTNAYIRHLPKWVNTLRPRQNGRHFADDTFKRIFVNENVRILTEISLKFVPKGPINNISSLVQTMAWRRPGDRPLSEPMMVCLPTHLCVTRPQWANELL